MSARQRFVRKPFKGWFAYEWQIGPVVFQFKHGTAEWSKPTRGFRIGRLYVWRDRCWRQTNLRFQRPFRG